MFTRISRKIFFALINLTGGCMPNRIIKLLEPNDYRNFKAWITDQNNLNPVFVASFKHPNEDGLIDMYCKVYPLEADDRSIFNEIVGYLVADALGIPQPAHACIAFIPTASILENDTVGFANTAIGRQFSNFSVYPVFCTAKIDKSETAFEYHVRSQKLIDELVKWPYISKAIAMDNTIAHIDRHVRNLLRTGKSKYHIIDNDQLVIKYNNCGWHINDLEVDKKYTNQLFDLSKQFMAPKDFNTIKSNMINECNTHRTAIDSISNEVNVWMNNLYSANDTLDYEVFIEFLVERADSAFAQVTSRADLLI